MFRLIKKNVFVLLSACIIESFVELLTPKDV